MSDNIVTENLKGVEIKFKLKSGVFSEKGLDLGTRLLIDSLKIREGGVIADLGSGNGVVGLVIAKLNRTGHVHLLEDHVRSANLAKENIALNDLRNVEVFLSDLFSAVGDRTYQVIVSNPPAHLGNEFLEEAASECLKHLKPKGEVSWVIPSHLKPVILRLFEKYFGNHIIMSTGKQHIVIKAIKND